jgi:TolB-like protein
VFCKKGISMRLGLFTIALFSMFTLSNAQKINIAVNELQSSGIESSAAMLISDRLRNELFNTSLFNVLERAEMEQILKEQGFQQSGCTSDACVVQAGQLLGVQLMIAGTVGKIGQTYTISVRAIDIQTGKIVHTANADCKCDIDDVLSKSTSLIAQKLTQNMRLQQSTVESTSNAPAPSYGRLSVKSEPLGAVVFLNGVRKGNTPYFVEQISPNKYTLKLRLPKYLTVIDSFSILAGQIIVKDYPLVREQVGKDISSSTAKNTPLTTNRNKNRHPIFKVTFSSTAIVAGAIGLIANNYAQKEIDRTLQIKQEYESAGTSYDSYAAEYHDTKKSADRYMLWRNISYGVSALSMAGFGVSFFF